MISHIAILIVAMPLQLVAAPDPVAKPVYTCKFETGQIVIEQADATDDVSVEFQGQVHRYVMEKLKLVPREQGLPSFLFQPDIKQWQWLNDKGDPIESTVCTEKPALKTG
jgi:hypothetical protein